MKHINWILLILVFALALVLTVSTGCTKQEKKAQAEKKEVELPPAVVEAVKANFPDAQRDFVEVDEEAGIKLYDIEFKDDQGEIEVAEDGTVIDVVTIITMEDVPQAAAEVFQKAAERATFKRFEKSEVRAEIRKEGEIGKIVKLDSPRYVYEAELVKDNQTGEIEVDAEGNIIEALKWETKRAKKKEEK